MTAGNDDAVLWHDLECGGYAEDLPLWRELAAAAPAGPILDVGAGTGRVAVDLAARGHEVVALDADAVLLAALAERAAAAGTPVRTVAADARSFALDATYALVLVPMQTVQLLGGAAGRAAFLARARAHLAAGGVLALAIADARDGVDEERREPPLPDVREVGGTLYASRPVALRDEDGAVAIERLREVVDARGRRRVELDVVRLDDLDAPTLEAEGRTAGLVPLPRRAIPQTEEYVGSVVVVLGG
ncbi:MAG TPA: methyltransferase domain-containing protein [Solirubrobacteraceae bacterium]|nr:methyltransferase domain-containing protein [Solirubrobacteraceae bacterium]